MHLLKLTAAVALLLFVTSMGSSQGQTKDPPNGAGKEPPASKPSDKDPATKPTHRQQPMELTPEEMEALVRTLVKGPVPQLVPLKDRQKRMVRWNINFDSGKPADYLDQLGSMGAFLGFPTEYDNKAEAWLYKTVRDLRKRPVELLKEDIAALNLIRWYCNDSKWAEAILGELKVDLKPTHFLVVFPRELEEQFAKVEEEYLKANKIELSKVEATNFRLKLEGKRYVPIITDAPKMRTEKKGTEPIKPPDKEKP